MTFLDTWTPAWWPKKEKDKVFWEPQFQVLATFNSEVARGLLHSEEWKAKMAQTQRWYDEKLRAKGERALAASKNKGLG